MNPPDHYFRQAAKSARRGGVVKGVDTEVHTKARSTLALALYNVAAKGIPLACGEMVFPFLMITIAADRLTNYNSLYCAQPNRNL